jgi:hypothetical protein
MTKRLCDYFVTLGSRAMLKAAVVGLLLLPVPAGAAPYTAPGNKVLWGGQGGYSAAHIRDFAQQSGKHPAVFNYFIEWKANDPTFHWLGFRLQDALDEGARRCCRSRPRAPGSATPSSRTAAVTTSWSA